MAVSIDQQFIEYIVKSLVGHPDDVTIERRIDEKGVLLELSVNPEDLGRVIGKRGSTAQSLRTLLRALGTKNDARYNLKIVDTGSPEDRPPRRDDSPAPDDNQAPVDEPGVDAATSDDSSMSDNSAAADEVDATEAELTEEATEADDNHSDVVIRARKELEELDDLEV